MAKNAKTWGETKGGVGRLYVSLYLCRGEATQEETLNLPGDNDLSPKGCMQRRRPLGRAQGSRAVDSQAGRGGGGGQGDWSGINTHCQSACENRKTIKNKKTTNGKRNKIVI